MSEKIPCVETYRGVGVHDQQPAERIEGVVKPAIDRVYGLTDPAALFAFAAESSNPPEARLLAAARCEAAWQLAAERRELRPSVDLEKLRAHVAGLNSAQMARLAPLHQRARSFAPRRQAGNAVGEGTMIGEISLPRLGPRDVERLRGAVEQMRAVGGDCAWLGDHLAAWLANLPDPRRSRRDAALVALAATFVGPAWSVAKDVERELRRYARSSWKSRDQYRASAPDGYDSQPRKLAAFEAMRAAGTDALIGPKQIQRVLETHVLSVAYRDSAGVAMSTDKPETLIHTQRKGRSAVNAHTPNSDAQFLDAIKRAPIGQTIIAADRDRLVAERRKAIAAIDALDAKAPAEFAKLEKAIKTAISARDEVRKQLLDADEKLRLASLAKSGASLAYDAERRRLEAILRDSPVATMLDDFQREMRDELEAARKKHEGGWVQDRNEVTRQPILRGFTNKASVNARLNAIHAAIAKAEELRLAADQSDVAAKLDALRASLPEIVGAIAPTVGVAA